MMKQKAVKMKKIIVDAIFFLLVWNGLVGFIRHQALKTWQDFGLFLLSGAVFFIVLPYWMQRQLNDANRDQ